MINFNDLDTFEKLLHYSEELIYNRVNFSSNFSSLFFLLFFFFFFLFFYSENSCCMRVTRDALNVRKSTLLPQRQDGNLDMQISGARRRTKKPGPIGVQTPVPAPSIQPAWNIQLLVPSWPNRPRPLFELVSQRSPSFPSWVKSHSFFPSFGYRIPRSFFLPILFSQQPEISLLFLLLLLICKYRYIFIAFSG